MVPIFGVSGTTTAVAKDDVDDEAMVMMRRRSRDVMSMIKKVYLTDFFSV